MTVNGERGCHLEAHVGGEDDQREVVEDEHRFQVDGFSVLHEVRTDVHKKQVGENQAVR